MLGASAQLNLASSTFPLAIGSAQCHDQPIRCAAADCRPRSPEAAEVRPLPFVWDLGGVTEKLPSKVPLRWAWELRGIGNIHRLCVIAVLCYRLLLLLLLDKCVYVEV